MISGVERLHLFGGTGECVFEKMRPRNVTQIPETSAVPPEDSVAILPG
jgi:hypothetical protein